MAKIAPSDHYGSPWHTALCEWLTTNGFDIKQVPMDAAIRISGDQLTVEVYMHDANGKLIRSDGNAVRSEKTVQMVSPPPDSAPLGRIDA